MNQLLEKLENSEGSFDVCKALLEVCFEDNLVSDEQVQILMDMFGDNVLASYALVYIYSSYKFLDLTGLQTIYEVIHTKFSDGPGNILVSSGLPITA